LLLGTAAVAGRIRVLAGLIVGCTWLAMVLTVVWVYTPQFNARYPIRAFTMEVQAHTAADRPLRLCGPLNDLALRFYLGGALPELFQAEEVLHYLERDGEALCIIEADWHQRLSLGAGRIWPVLARGQLGGATLLLIANR
jgi:hypothetical protein